MVPGSRLHFTEGPVNKWPCTREVCKETHTLTTHSTDEQSESPRLTALKEDASEHEHLTSTSIACSLKCVVR